MHALFNELAAVGKPTGKGKLISFIVAGLDMEYQAIVSALDVSPVPISLDQRFSLVSNYDQRMEMFHGIGSGAFNSSANSASCGRQGSNKGYHNQNKGGGGGGSCNNGGHYGGGGYGSNSSNGGGGYNTGGNSYGAGGGGYPQNGEGGGYNGGGNGYHHRGGFGRGNNNRHHQGAKFSRL
nr:abscisic acid and environmental stress-inducible protein-like [Aegilops tauschii subsp. strangulata]